MSEELAKELADFWEELDLEVESTGDLAPAAFFSIFARIAADNGDCTDLVYTPVIREGRGSFQIDGIGLELERNELHVAICDFRQSRELETINARELDAQFQRVRRFIEAAVEPEFIAAIEEESPAFQAAFPIFENWQRIRRVRILLLTNARLAIRSQPEAIGEILGTPVVRNILDLRRYAEIMRSLGSPEPIEIDLEALNDGPLACLPAHGSSGTYEAYLVALPGELLAKVYGLWGARLLEQNVRSFLQAKTKVNKGIIETIQNYPGMFFAYNNGITATASGIKTVPLEGGGLGISSIENLQIVNGGQTTASILYAKDSNKTSDLSEVFVQMKLAVVTPALVEEVVPDISRFANTQNKVSEADFFSNHPFHVEMEKLSRRLPAPPKPGSFVGSKWFYERARGQYRYGQASGQDRDKRKFEVEFPRDQVISKIEIAKYALTFDQLPFIVSRGETKFFLEFAERVGAEWAAGQDDFNENYFKSLVAKAIVFRRLDKLTGKADWYKEDRGYKAQTITYSIAWLVNYLEKEHGKVLNLLRVWTEQELSAELEQLLLNIATRVARELRDAPANVKNIGEYSKQKICWDAIRALDIKVPHFESITVPRDDVRKDLRDAREINRTDKDIEFDILLLKFPAAIGEIVDFARARRLLSPKSNAALTKLARGKLSLAVPERNALKNLVLRMREAGFDFGRYP